jgi:hypothetical protein
MHRWRVAGASHLRMPHLLPQRTAQQVLLKITSRDRIAHVWCVRQFAAIQSLQVGQ